MMTRFASLAALLAFLAGCGPPPPTPPEGFTIAVRFVSLDIAVLESVRVRVQPPPTTRFAEIDETQYESGGITLRQEADSSLVFELTGAHVRERAMRAPGGPEMIYEMQVWSDDPVMMTGPLLLGSAMRSGTAIGEGTVYLPSWPPPIEDEEGRCSGSACQATLSITCTAQAASMGLCLP